MGSSSWDMMYITNYIKARCWFSLFSPFVAILSILVILIKFVYRYCCNRSILPNSTNIPRGFSNVKNSSSSWRLITFTLKVWMLICERGCETLSAFYVRVYIRKFLMLIIGKFSLSYEQLESGNFLHFLTYYNLKSL